MVPLLHMYKFMRDQCAIAITSDLSAEQHRGTQGHPAVANGELGKFHDPDRSGKSGWYVGVGIKLSCVESPNPWSFHGSSFVVCGADLIIGRRWGMGAQGRF